MNRKPAKMQFHRETVMLQQRLRKHTFYSIDFPDVLKTISDNEVFCSGRYKAEKEEIFLMRKDDRDSGKLHIRPGLPDLSLHNMPHAKMGGKCTM